MTKWTMSAAVACLLTIATPAPAAAQFWDVIRWLNDMSGPQMFGTVLDVPIVAGYQSSEPRLFLDATEGRADDRRRWVLSGRAGYFANTTTLGEQEEVNRLITGLILGAGVTVKSTIPRLYYTGAADFFKFGGAGVPDDFWVPTLSAGLVVRPFDENGVEALRQLRLSLRYQLFLDTFEGDRFGAPGTFRSETEGVWQIGVGWVLF